MDDQESLKELGDIIKNIFKNSGIFPLISLNDEGGLKVEDRGFSGIYVILILIPPLTPLASLILYWFSMIIC